MIIFTKEDSEEIKEMKKETALLYKDMNFKVWIVSPDGQKRLKQLAKENAEFKKKLFEASYVSDELLKKKMDF